MPDFDLNLSTRPFPAYRLINIALGAVLAVLLVGSVWQAVGFARYSRLARSIRSGEQDMRVEATSLGTRVAELEARLDRPEAAAKLNEITFLNRAIARKSFSWTRLFANLEDMVPENVHLTNLTPGLGDNGGVTLQIGVRGRSIEDMKEFIARLEKSPVFGKVIVSAEEKRDPAIATDVDITLTTIYFPQRDTR